MTVSLDRLRFETATTDHVRGLLPRLRRADWREVAASTVLPVGHALAMSVARGNAQAGFIDDELISVFGAPATGGLGRAATPWMVGSDKIELHPQLVARQSLRIMREWTDAFDLLSNYVDARNTVSKRWLKWLGFKLGPARPYGPQKQDFHRFEWRR